MQHKTRKTARSTMKKPQAKRLQLKGVNKETVNLCFSRSFSAAAVREFKIQAKKLVQAKRANLEIDPKLQKWVEEVGPDLRGKLTRLGIKSETDVEQELAAASQLGPWNSRFSESKRGETQRKLIDAARRLERFFGPKKDMRSITKIDAVDFRNWLIEHEGLKQTSTVPRVLGYVNQIFNAAKDEELISRNPFSGKHVPKVVKTDKEKHHYIDAEATEKLRNVINDDDDRLRFVLLRYLGLRAPSELNALRWKDFDWNSGFVTIRAEKTKHHHDQGYRKCPFRHEVVEPVVRAAYQQRESDEAPVVKAISAPALRRRFIKLIGKAGLELWDGLFVNFRRSAVTDALDKLPAHVCEAYFGHSEAIAKANYAMQTEAHVKAFGAVSQKPTTLKLHSEEVA